MEAKKMLEMVQLLKEQSIIAGFEMTEDIKEFFNLYWMHILDILDDLLYMYINNG